MQHPILSRTIPQLFGNSMPSGDVGIELEIEGENLPRTVTNWQRKPEGSLRGRDGRTVEPGEDQADTPQEYVSRGPILMGSVRGNLNALCTKLQTGGAVVRLTPRASTHIHLNMTMDTVQTFLLYTVVFTMAEPVLLRFCGPLRNGNLFCLPTYETGELPVWVSKLHGVCDNNWPSTDHIRHYWPKRGKYASLNLDPVTSFGSVETRCFPNSVNPDEITGWAEMLVKMREIARGLTLETAQHFIDRAYAEPMWFLGQIFPLNNIYSVCHPTHPAELVSYGVEHGYEVWKQLRAFGSYTEKKERKKAKRITTDDWINTAHLLNTPAPVQMEEDDEF